MTELPVAVGRDHVASTENCLPDHVGDVGGKAVGLGSLLRAGQRVPVSFVVTADAYRQYLATQPRQLPAPLRASIAAAYAALCERHGTELTVAVRSSATVEDSAEASWAGQFQTFLGVAGAAEVLARVEECWAAALDPQVGAYRVGHRPGAGDGVAVIVQELVDARAAGVMFTQHPETGDRSLIVIESSFGLGEAVVGGDVVPDLFEINKITRQPHRSRLGSKHSEHRLLPGGRGVAVRPVEPGPPAGLVDHRGGGHGAGRHGGRPRGQARPRPGRGMGDWQRRQHARRGSPVRTAGAADHGQAAAGRRGRAAPGCDRAHPGPAGRAPGGGWCPVSDPIAGTALTGAEAIGAVVAGAVSVSDVVEDCLGRVAELDAALGAFRIVNEQGARSRAKQLDNRVAGPLHGLVAAVKDVIDTADLPTGYGSALFADHQPAADADVVTALRRAGAVVLGKTESTEFAMFQPTRTRNPVDPGRTPGGSSSGSAAAVAAGMVPVALGTQTAGSVIRPAAYCGVYGFKPAWGWTPTTGIWRLSEHLDTVGLFARSVADLRLTYHALRSASDQGHARQDRAAAAYPVRPPSVGVLTGGGVGPLR